MTDFVFIRLEIRHSVSNTTKLIEINFSHMIKSTRLLTATNLTCHHSFTTYVEQIKRRDDYLQQNLKLFFVMTGFFHIVILYDRQMPNLSFELRQLLIRPLRFRLFFEENAYDTKSNSPNIRSDTV